jgi:hypothetical protein
LPVFGRNTSACADEAASARPTRPNLAIVFIEKNLSVFPI